jgi:hypothetical protein
MVHGNYYEDRLGAGITLSMAQWMRQEDPEAVLYLNDYDILTGRRDRLELMREPRETPSGRERQVREVAVDVFGGIGGAG